MQHTNFHEENKTAWENSTFDFRKGKQMRKRQNKKFQSMIKIRNLPLFS